MYSLNSNQYVLHSDNDALSYNGFVQQTSADGSVSPINYASSTEGDTARLRFNGQSLANNLWLPPINIFS